MYTLRLLALTADTIRFSYSFCTTFTTVLIRVSVALYVLGQMTGERWFAWHAAWTGVDSIQWSDTPAAPVVYAAPIACPLFDIAAELESCTCRQLREQFGLRQRTSRHRLIAFALTC